MKLSEAEDLKESMTQKNKELESDIEAWKIKVFATINVDMNALSCSLD